MSEDIISRLQANDPSLRLVDIDLIDGVGLDRFCAAVPENSSIRKLDIFDQFIDAVAAEKLSVTLRKMPFLESFIIHECPWDGVEVSAMLVSSLADRDSLQVLGLYCCNLNDGGVQTICTSFSTHDSLRRLFIEDISITNIGAISIGSMLMKNNTLELISLREANICAEGFEAISSGVSKNTTLSYLALDVNAAIFTDFENAFRKVLYNDDSIESVLTKSNHTLLVIDTHPKRDELIPLLAMDLSGPKTARRRKIIRFLNEKPGSLISTRVNEKILPSAIVKIGRVGGVSAVNELVRAMPDIFDRKASRKRSRS